eukprot:2528599-Rhodomonas_salina.1
MWRSTGFQSLSFHDVAQCCDSGSVSFIHDERERTVSPCLEEADKALEQAEQRVKQKIKQSRYALLRFTLQNQKASEDRHAEKRKRLAQVPVSNCPAPQERFPAPPPGNLRHSEGGKENTPLGSQVASAASGASKRARSMAVAALAGEEQAPAALPPTRAHTAAEDAPLPPSAFCSKRSAAPEQEERGADAEAKRLGQHSQQQPPTGPAAATRASRHAAAAEGQKRRGEKDDADADGEEEGG